MVAWLGALGGRFVLLVALALVCFPSETVTWLVGRLGGTLRTADMLTAKATGVAIKGTAPVMRQHAQDGQRFPNS